MNEELLREEVQVVRVKDLELRLRSELDVPVSSLLAVRVAKAQLAAPGPGLFTHARGLLVLLSPDPAERVEALLERATLHQLREVLAVALGLPQRETESEGVRGTLSLDALLAAFMRAYGQPLREAMALSMRHLRRLVELAEAQNAQKQLEGIRVVQYPNLAARSERQQTWEHLERAAKAARWFVPDEWESYARERASLFGKLSEFVTPAEA